MTTTTWLVLLIAGWLASGVLIAMVLGRRGFDAFSWFLIATMLGPLTVLIAWNCVRRDEHLRVEVLSGPSSGSASGPVDVLVGVDGSPQAHAAIASVVELLGGRLGRLTFATVVPFDESPEAETDARTMLELEAQRFPTLTPELALVHGHPATALAAAGREGGFDLLAIGTTGQGHAHLFGSAATELARRSDVPVLLS